MRLQQVTHLRRVGLTPVSAQFPGSLFILVFDWAVGQKTGENNLFGLVYKWQKLGGGAFDAAIFSR